MSRRTEMLGSTIQRELMEIIMRELNDPRLTGFPSITRVKVLPDLSVAEVFVTIMGTPGQQSAALNALKHSAGMMRTKLTKVLSVRQAPFLQFKFDEQLKKELEVLGLLEKVRKELHGTDDHGSASADPERPSDGDDAAPAASPVDDAPGQQQH